MSEISKPAAIMLDALLHGRIDLGFMFLKKDKFVDFFNVPWHELSASACCLELSKIFRLGMIDLHEEEDRQMVKATIGLTSCGALCWAKHFLADENKYIDNEILLDNARAIITFSSPSIDRIELLRSKILTIVGDSSGIDVDAVVASEQWKKWLWTRKKSAFEFKLTAESPEWIDSLEYASISEAMLELSDGWRKRP